METLWQPLANSRGFGLRAQDGVRVRLGVGSALFREMSCDSESQSPRRDPHESVTGKETSRPKPSIQKPPDASTLLASCGLDRHTHTRRVQLHCRFRWISLSLSLSLSLSAFSNSASVRASSRLRPHFRQKTASSAYTLPQAGQLVVCRLTAWGFEFVKGFWDPGCETRWVFGFVGELHDATASEVGFVKAAQLRMLNDTDCLGNQEHCKSTSKTLKSAQGP